MATTLKIARPFSIIGADGYQFFSWGIGVYPDVDDSLAAHFFVKLHLQDAILQQGLRLCQQRWLNNKFEPGRDPPLVWIDRESASIYGGDLMPDWPPVYADDIALRHFFKINDANADSGFVRIGTDAAGEPIYRQHQSDHRIMLHTHQRRLGPLPERTIRVRPGDPTPPIAAAADNGNRDRERRERFAFDWRQMTQRRIVAEQSMRYIEPERASVPPPQSVYFGEQRTPVMPRQDLSVYTYVDPRQ